MTLRANLREQPEGATPLDDISGLKRRDVSTRAQLHAVEAQNVLRATVKYLAARPTPRRAPFDLAWMKRLHAEMFGDVWEWAGRIRTVELNLGLPAHRVEVALRDLSDDLHAWGAGVMPRTEQAARLHHRAVSIHPFLNGNGRWARMLANVWLAQHGAPLTRWPTDVDDASSVRAAYLAALRAADAHDDGPLLVLHQRYGKSEGGGP